MEDLRDFDAIANSNCFLDRHFLKCLLRCKYQEQLPLQLY